MTGTELKAALDELGMTSKFFARNCGVNQSTISRYINGTSPIPKMVDWLVELLREHQARAQLWHMLKEIERSRSA